jgi:hypothetical protein
MFHKTTKDKKPRKMIGDVSQSGYLGKQISNVSRQTFV